MAKWRAADQATQRVAADCRQAGFLLVNSVSQSVCGHIGHFFDKVKFHKTLSKSLKFRMEALQCSSKKNLGAKYGF